MHSLHSVHDEDKPFELELAWICDASGRLFQRVPADVAAAAEAAAKSALEESDMCAHMPIHACIHPAARVLHPLLCACSVFCGEVGHPCVVLPVLLHWKICTP